MLATSARLLRLLSLLQAPARDWSGPQLAQRLGVSTRTVRTDVERLRQLGYPVQATPGVAGGYRLGAGATLPPLLLDDEEAMAVAVGLRVAATGGVTGIEESSMRALAKLEQVLPSRLRHRINAVHGATVAMPATGPRSAPRVAAEVLTTLAETIRDRDRLAFMYQTVDGSTGRRSAEPYRLVHTRGRWYLVAWDLDREDWRIFRVDRLQTLPPFGPRFSPRPEPADGLLSYVEKSLGTATWRYRARVRVHTPAAAAAARLPPAVLVEPLDEGTCLVTVGSDGPAPLASYLGMMDADFDVDSREHPDLAECLRTLSARYARAVGEPAPRPGPPAG